jgi:hypothetical protein
VKKGETALTSTTARTAAAIAAENDRCVYGMYLDIISFLMISVLRSENMKSDSTRIIKAVIFDLDGTLLDTEALSDRATLEAFGDAIPLDAREEMRRNGNVLPWEIKSQILGLRGDKWIPMVIEYGREHWGILKEGEELSGQPPPSSV